MTAVDSILSTITGKWIELIEDPMIRLFFWFLFYIILIWFVIENQKTAAAGLAYTPILATDYVHSYGTYSFHLPFDLLPIITTKLVLTLNALDFFFNFGIFKMFGLAEFSKVNGEYPLGAMQEIFIYVFMYLDSFILFCLLAYILYEVSNRLDIAVIGSLIPVALIALYFNPIKEMTVATNTVKHVLYFMNHATDVQLLIVCGSVFMSFIIVVIVISIGINIFVGIGKRTVKPGWETSMWETSFTGIAFMITLVYAVAQILHPEYQWYVMIPALIVFGIIKNSLGGYADHKKQDRHEDNRVKRIVEESRQ